MAEEQQVYMSAVKTVTKARDSQGRLHCIHSQHFPSLEACEKAYQRLQTQKQLQHPSICQVFEVQRVSNSLNTDMEWCGQALHTLQCAWTQEDCWQLLCSVSGALAYAQLQGVAHGALQPEVIHWTEEGGYKVGNFECVTKSTDSDYLIHVKKPMFLSPEAKRAFIGLYLGETVKETSSDPFKSEVYSLGITILSLVTPESLPTLGNSSAIQTVISSVPLHCAFRRLLMRMLEPEVLKRPDWKEMEEAVGKTQQEMAETTQNSVQVSVRKRIRVIKKPKVTEITAVSPSICATCKASFVLDSRDSWRLDLIGSTSSQEAAKYCSSLCFQQTFSPPKAKAPHHSTIAELFPDLAAEDMEEEEFVEPYLQFYHCFRHTVFSSVLHHSDGPTVLAACPECPSGEVSSEVVFGLQIKRNSLYPSLIFIQEYVITAFEFIPIAAVFHETLLRAQCHICGQRLQLGAWMCFFHGERLDLACCACFLKALKGKSCPTCGLPVEQLPSLFGTTVVSESAKMLALEWAQGRILSRSEAWCYTCSGQPAEWTLPCGHSFCLACLSLQPHLPEVDSFGCMRCGCVIVKQDHPDLMLLLGREGS